MKEYHLKLQQNYLFFDMKLFHPYESPHHVYIIYKQKHNDVMYKKHCLLSIHW